MNENVNFICNFISEEEIKKKKKKGTGRFYWHSWAKHQGISRTTLKMHIKCGCNLMSINSILNIRYGLLVK